MESGLDGPVHECVGCNFCCRKAPCVAAYRVYGKHIKVCPGIKWDESKRRYFCELCLKPGKLGETYREELCVGQGCCCPLNSWRQNIPPPEMLPERYCHASGLDYGKEENAAKKVMLAAKEAGVLQVVTTSPGYALSNDAKAILRAVARSMCSGDLIWLAIHSASDKLGKPKGFTDACFEAMREQRPSHVESFIGKIEK